MLNNILSLGLFDICINLIEAFLYVLFIYMVLHKKRNIISLIIVTMLYFFNTSLCNFFQISEMILIGLGCIIALVYANYLNGKQYIMSNICLILLLEGLFSMSLSISMIITACFFGFPFYEGKSYIVLCILSKLIFAGLVFFTAPLIKKYDILKTNKIKFLLVSMVIADFIYGELTDLVYYEGYFGNIMMVLFVLMNLLMVSLFVVYIQTRKEQEERLELQRKILETEATKKIEKINQEKLEEIRKWKHDMNHTLSLIKYYIQKGEYETAMSHINDQHHHLFMNTLIPICHYAPLDYLISEKYEMIQEHDILIQTSYDQSPCLMKEEDFFALMGNLLDNAIENCSGHKKRIEIEIKSEYSQLRMIIKNTIEESVLEKNFELKTTKEEDHHGIGLNSVKTIVEKYNGRIHFEEMNGYFIVNIWI